MKTEQPQQTLEPCIMYIIYKGAYDSAIDVYINIDPSRHGPEASAQSSLQCCTG